MAFHFTSFSLTIPGGGGVLPTPEITASCQPRDRRTQFKGMNSSVLISLIPNLLPVLPLDYQGFTISRSTDGITFAAVSGLITTSSFYIDRPGLGVFWYRATLTTAFGGTSSAGPSVQVRVADWDSAEDGGVNDVDVTGSLTDKVGRGVLIPNGLNAPCAGMGIAEGSFAGSSGAASFFIETGEAEPPISTTEVPACGDLSVALPVTVMTYTLEDQPNPGGSGIDEPSILIWLSVASVDSGSHRLIWDGAADPWNPTVTVGIVNGADPVLQRDITITVAAGYIVSGDVVIITTFVKDLDGNEATLTCTWTAASTDVTPPEVSQNSPVCGLGTTTGDLGRASRDTTYSFRVTDDVAVDLATLDAYHGLTSTGPWTQVLQAGGTFLASWTGVVQAIVGEPVSGYDVVLRRPVGSPLWPADTTIFMRVTADDTSGNSVEDICSFRTEAESFIRQVYVLGERLILIEFSMPMKILPELQKRENYTLAPVDSDTADPVFTREAMPQKFTTRPDEQNPNLAFGQTITKFVFLRTSTYSTWQEYILTVANLVDRHDQPMASNGKTFRFRARRTKFDSMTEDFQKLSDRPGEFALDEGEGVDAHAIMASFGYLTDFAGGTFVNDDWFDS